MPWTQEREQLVAFDGPIRCDLPRHDRTLARTTAPRQPDAMIDQHLDLTTTDGQMNTFITHPEEGGPHPVVFFYMDAPGKREELHDMARRLGTAGYYVVLPNLYYRSTREFDATVDFAAHGEQMGKLMFSVGYGMIRRDTEAMLEFVDADPAADASRIGAVGYCMSGPFAYAVAGMFPDRIQAAASCTACDCTAMARRKTSRNT